MKFMLMMHTPGGGPYQVARWAPEELRAHLAFMRDFARRLAERGELVAAEGLAGPDLARRVKAGPDGEPVTDGVFPETKEFLAGYWIVDVEDEQRAWRIAADASLAPGPSGRPLHLTLEVRQVMSGPPVE